MFTRRFASFVPLSAVSLFLLSSCFGSGGSGEPGQAYETTSLEVAIDAEKAILL